MSGGHNEPHGRVFFFYTHRSATVFCHPGALFSAARLVGDQWRRPGVGGVGEVWGGGVTSAV